MSANGLHFVYLHGFASSPASAKAVFFRERLAAHGVALQAPDLNAPSFRELTLTRNLAHVEALVPAGARAVIIGSSLGGYTAALFAHRHPERVAALVLMAPAFNMARLLTERHGAEAMRRWREAGQVDVDHPGYGAPQPLAWSFQEDAERWAQVDPRVGCPTLILHGVHDRDVPLAGSQAYAARLPNVELVPLPSDHSLTDVLDTLWQRTGAFLAPWLPARTA